MGVHGVVILFCLINCFSISSSAKGLPQHPEIPIIPDQIGFGVGTRAAYGGKEPPIIIKVTNLNSRGKGSLREAIEHPKPRVIVFEVSGQIELKDTLRITSPFVTIAGQTAPSPGITLKQTTVSVQTHDVLIQHIRMRQGDGEGLPEFDERDCISIGNSILGEVYNVVIDHCSFSWATDENTSVWNFADKVSFLNCINSEALYKSFHPEGPHSKGSLLSHKADRISIIGCLYAHNHERNPLARNKNLLMLHNLVYNYVNKALELQNHDELATNSSVIGNVFVEGPNTNSKAIYIRGNSRFSVNEQSKVYLESNSNLSPVLEQWDLCQNTANTKLKVDQPPVKVQGTIQRHCTPEHLLECILVNVGARPWDRDTVDQRIVSEVRSRTGKMINSQTEVGGFPELVQRTHDLDLPKDLHGDSDGNGYTNVEEWLHHFANPGSQNSPF